MRITRTVAAVGLAGVMGLTGLGVAAAATPSPDSTGGGGLVEALRGALDALVGDGTLTDEQADAVAGTLAESDALRHGGGHHGGRGLVDLDVAATTLGLGEEELRTALSADGATLAGVAADRGVDTQRLVDALVAAATEGAERAVVDGRLTRAEADARIAALPDRVAAVVQEELRGHRHGRGGRGPCPDDATRVPQDATTGSLGRAADPRVGPTA